MGIRLILEILGGILLETRPYLIYKYPPRNVLVYLK
jgi:hypothetical protein